MSRKTSHTQPLPSSNNLSPKKPCQTFIEINPVGGNGPIRIQLVRIEKVNWSPKLDELRDACHDRSRAFDGPITFRLRL